MITEKKAFKRKFERYLPWQSFFALLYIGERIY